MIGSSKGWTGRGKSRAARSEGPVVGGLERFSMVDWPGKITATVFCQGCGWRCRYCHNPGLISFRGAGVENSGEREWTWPAVLAWLGGRRGLLDGVVFSGGEPTLQPGLADAMRATRALGFGVGLHTGGPVPERLEEVLPMTDWVGFDFKAPFEEYLRVTGRAGGGAARRSLQRLRAAGVEMEVRTTWHPRLLSADDLGAMADALVAEGVEEWVLQRFRPEGCGDEELNAGAAGMGELPLAELARRRLRIGVR